MNEFAPKREWPDGEERVVDGAIVVYGKGQGPKFMMHVNQTPSEVKKIRDEARNDDMIELAHHADPETKVYVNRWEIIAIDARFKAIGDE